MRRTLPAACAWFKVICIALVLVVPACNRKGGSSEDVSMAMDLIQLANSTDDPMELVEAAEALAASRTDAEQLQLRKALCDESFLLKLDSPSDYLKPPRQLRLAGILKTLSENSSPSAQQTLLALAVDPMFTSVEPRQDLLIRMLVPIRPAQPAAIAFWREHSTPRAPYKHVTADALADNGSEPAVRLLEEMLADSAHDEQDRVAWMRDPVLRHRDNTVVLEACWRLLQSDLSPELKNELVAALFDYREEWYLSCTPPQPPDWTAFKPDARRVLARIGEYARDNLQLDPRTKAAVEARLKVIRD